MAPRPKSVEELKTERIAVMMAPDEVKALEDWMFKNRIRSMGEAIRQLVKKGVKDE